MRDFALGVAFFIVALLVVIYVYHKNSYKYENIKKSINNKLITLRKLKDMGETKINIEDQEKYLINLLKEKMSNLKVKLPE